MTINFPANRKEVIDRTKSDVQGELPQSNPFLRNSFLSAMLVAFAGRNYEVYLQMQQVLNEMFPDTATGDYLLRWGSYVGLTPNPATQARGNITATGINGATITAGTEYQTQSGNSYITQATAVLATVNLTISNLVYSSSTVTVTTSTAHNFASGILVDISGAAESDYNGTFTIFVTGLNTFTYQIAGNPSSPATGTPIATATVASVPVLSQDVGDIQNLDEGAALVLTSPIAGIDANAYVQFTTIAGGADEEDQEAFRARVLRRYQNPITPFNEANIIDVAQTVNGVTRVFVQQPDTTVGSNSVSSITRTGTIATVTTVNPHGLVSGAFVSITGANEVDYNIARQPILVLSSTTFIYIVANSPATPATGVIVAQYSAVEPGQVKVLFMRDNDANNIPSGGDVLNVKNALLRIKPAHMSEKDLIVLAPTAVPVSFVFSSLTPNTQTMKDAVTANLDAFFRQSTIAGENLLRIAYSYAIYLTVDPVTGESLQNYALATPTSDVAVSADSIATLGTVTFL